MTEKQFFHRLSETLQTELELAGETNQKFFKRLMKLLQENIGELESREGEERTQFLRRIFVNAGYNRYWQQLRRQFEQILESQNRLWRDETTKPAPLARSNTRLTAFEKVNFTRFGNLGEDAVKELKKQFDEGFRENKTRQQIIEAIRPISQKTERFAGTIAGTALRGWDRTVTATKAEIAGVEQARFAGPPPIETSHQFCIDNYQQVYTRSEIESMTNGQLEPVIAYGGGYECRHSWWWLVREILK